MLFYLTLIINGLLSRYFRNIPKTTTFKNNLYYLVANKFIAFFLKIVYDTAYYTYYI